MDLALLVYGISVLTKLGVFIILLVIFSVFTLLFSLIAYSAETGASERIAKKWATTSAIVLSIVISISIILPNEKTMYTMVGAYAAQKVAENPKVQQLSAKVLTIVENKLDSYIEEATKK